MHPNRAWRGASIGSHPRDLKFKKGDHSLISQLFSYGPYNEAGAKDVITKEGEEMTYLLLRPHLLLRDGRHHCR